MKYEVIQSGLDSHKIGDIIELTNAQAKSRINKVKLIAEVEVVAAPKKKGKK